MVGTRRIVLREPQPTGERALGGKQRYRPPKLHVVYAIREAAKGGSEGLIAEDVVGAEAKRVYRFPEDNVAGVVDESWDLVDERGVVLDIESVGEQTAGPRRRWLRVVAVRHTKGRTTQ